VKIALAFTIKNIYAKRFIKEFYMTRVVLINNQWAFDLPYQTPPNVVVTG
jgi:hypothetical protein